MEVPFLDLARETARHHDEIQSSVQRVVTNGWYVLGPEVEAFEAEFAAKVGAKYCVGVGNGLEAMALTLRAWGIGPGDEVIVPANTYVATWLAVTQSGATVVPVEPDRSSMNVEASSIESAITSRTAAVLPVHLYGRPVPMDPIVELAAARGLRVLDDAAQAHGAIDGARPIGSAGDATAWSFYPTKNLGAFGDAGAVTTSDAETAQVVSELRNYGSATRYVSERRGFNSRLDELQAAVLRVKLRHLDDTIARRNAIAERYLEELADQPITLPKVVDPGRHAWHLFVVRHPQRDSLRERLAVRGIGSVVHYPICPHRQRAYADLGWGPGAFPVSERIHDEVLSLPLAPYMTDDEQTAVVAAVRASLVELS